MRLANFSLLVLFLLLALSAEGKEPYSIAPSNAEKQKIKEGVQAMHDALVKGDLDVILALTYPELIRFSGGDDVFKASIQHAIDQLVADGMKLESYQLGEPSPMYLAGSDWLCFVPEYSVATIKGQRFRSTGFVIGVKSGTSTKWKFLEGRHLKKDPAALWRLFPDLPGGIKLPPIKQEVLEDKPGIPK